METAATGKAMHQRMDFVEEVSLVAGEAIARYGFPQGHPFGPDRHDVFIRHLENAGLNAALSRVAPRAAASEELGLFHSADHVRFVREMSEHGEGFLDYGDTPAFPGVYDAAAAVVGAVLEAGDLVAAGRSRRAFVPIAGMHHSARGCAAGFCAFNDVGVLVEWLRERHGMRCLAYVDIDAHHGDGVYYGFEQDPDVIVADIHEDGRFLYPGTGRADERGRGEASGTKLNLPLPPGAGDAEFAVAWDAVEAFLEDFRPEMVIFQCGADGLAGDPLTHLAYSHQSHRLAARRLCRYADRYCDGRLVALGGGGYDRQNLVRAWTEVVGALIEER